MIFGSIAIFLLIGVINCSEDILEKISLENYPLALCNDKTTAVYYRHPEISQHPNKKMLIYLKGGGLCVPGDGYSSCNNRCNVAAPHLCTAMTDPTLDLGENNLGSTIASSNSTLNPAFHDFSKIYVPYCSSDLYSGTANASVETEDRVFHGKFIFKAIITDLMEKTWLDQADEVVLVGTSAGAMGVERNCDWMADQLRGTKPNMNIKCIIDSGTLYPMNTYYDYCFENSIDVSERQAYWEADLDESCMKDSPDPDACTSLSRSYPYLETTTMILTSANDDVLTNPCNNKNDEVFKKPWRDELASLVRMMSADRPDFGFYIENCPYHTVVPNLWLYHLHQVPVDDGSMEEMLTPRELIANFWNQSGPMVGIDDMEVLNPHCNPF